MKLLYRLLFILAVAISSTSCDDRLFREYSDIGDGESRISATVNFIPEAKVLGSRATAGDAIEDITSLSVVVYDQYQNFYKFFPNVKFTASTNNDRPQLSTEDVKYKAEFSDRSHASATFTLPEVLPYGRYYIYCVANMPNITEEQVQTIEDLRSIKVDWLAEVAQNNQMFGFFTNEDKKSSADSYSGFDALPVVVNKTNLSIHAWINRLASKVTVEYDGSNLNQDVFVYIRKVRIKDIPKSCTLGYDNSPHTTDSLMDGDLIYYAPLANATLEGSGISDTDPGEGDFENWMVVANNGVIRGSHAYNASSLFFYENMQGDYSGRADKEKFNKEPEFSNVQDFLEDLKEDPTNPEIVPSNYDKKDNVPFGTYIEVEGYYLSQNPQNPGAGPIRYRFMLGKNTTYNYNAQRNHHYKVTLGFNGWANQPEWHIDYVEENPAVLVPDRFYMPYLYNQKADFPIKFNGNCQSIKVEILENSWGPKEIKDFTVAPKEEVPSSTPVRDPNMVSDYYNFVWNRPVWEEYKGTTHPFLGYLALTVPSDNPDANILLDIDYRTGPAAYAALQAFYEAGTYSGENLQTKTVDEFTNGTPGYKNTIPQNVREFKNFSSVGNHYTEGTENVRLNDYTITNKTQDGCDMTVPFFTRPKNMIHNSDFSGNNPYRYFIRYAKVMVTAVFKTSTGFVNDTVYTDVLQVPRTQNPKAVWRKSGSTESFKVIMTRGIGPGGNDNFEPIVSDGSWTAEVDQIGDYGNFYLSTVPDGRYISATSTRIEGRTLTNIKFKINFKGAQNACGIVTVRYHGQTCVHKIMLRQGYDPIQITDRPTLWTSFNLVSANDPKSTFSGNILNYTSMSSGDDKVTGVVANSPLFIGSLFKKGNYNQGILADNGEDYPPLYPYNNTTFNYSFQITNTTAKLSWGDIRSVGNTSSTGAWSGPKNDKTDWIWAKFEVDGKTYRLPDYDDFRDITDNCDFGFGALYGDGATETQLDYYEATGFNHTENEDIGKNPDHGSIHGARGCVVYNQNNAKQIFFPIGKQGNGRRTCFNLQSVQSVGVMRYADVSKLLEGGTNIYRPMDYNLAHFPGAIYWIRQTWTAGGSSNTDDWAGGWDMNFMNVHFNAYTDNGWLDAMPIRLVVDN